MIRSPTTESTILPKAAPMMTPTARSTTLPFIANCRNSLPKLIAFPLADRAAPAPSIHQPGRKSMRRAHLGALAVGHGRRAVRPPVSAKTLLTRPLEFRVAPEPREQRKSFEEPHE